ncbi:zinc-ribbon domain-containing protein [Desulfovibrio psychrotolerans]|uniref:Yip1 domain-containing protein n=1 Tax=Desulfovibrio psychrotolerans TaxID=415242 RepID=A0A7J0BU25_9BACT|nr:zinc-ribbon domain-containing protein [Desulfovibrio psychrotolerans]GFM37168.1 hypothetical protein DSM19430T_18520 [Desulfovibrio psychrotolerans]
MEIRCPECAYSREVDEASLRPSLTMATCPQCGTRFRFREPDKADFLLEPESDRPRGDDADALPTQWEADQISDQISGQISDQISGQNSDPLSDPMSGQASEPLADKEMPKSSGRQPDVSARRPPDEEEARSRNADQAERTPQDFHRRQDGTGEAEERTAPGQGTRMEPWAYVREAGFIPAFVETTRQILLAPQYFFSSLGKDVPFVYPFAYYLLVSVIGILAETLWQTVVGNPILPEAFSGAVESPGELAAILLFSPVIMTLYLYVLGGVLHLVLVLTGVTRGSANTTLRVVCYSGAADLLSLVPVVGTLLGGLVRLWLIAVGLKAAYGTGYGRILPALGVLLLVLFIFVLVVMRDAGVV